MYLTTVVDNGISLWVVRSEEPPPEIVVAALLDRGLEVYVCLI